MDIALWIVQGIAAAMFMMAGAMKLMRTREQLRSRMAWVDAFSDAQVKGIGVLEMLGAAGLILPGVVGAAGVLTPIAAVGLAILMGGAVITHIRRGEAMMAAMPMMLFVASVFIAVGRFGPEPL